AGQLAQFACCQVVQPEVVGHIAVAVIAAVAEEGQVAAIGRTGAFAVVEVTCGQLLWRAAACWCPEEMRAPLEVALAVPAVDLARDDARTLLLVLAGTLAFHCALPTGCGDRLVGQHIDLEAEPASIGGPERLACTTA